MNLFWHLTIHLALSILAGSIIFIIFRKFWPAFLSAIIAGVVIDFDHLIDYFLAFGGDFHLNYFLSGYQFLKTDKIYIWFHAWEYVIIFIIAAIIIKNSIVKITLFSLALGLFFHLSADCLLNEGMRPQAYSIIYRIKNNFDAERLVTAEHWQKHNKQKETVSSIFNQ